MSTLDRLSRWMGQHSVETLGLLLAILALILVPLAALTATLLWLIVAVGTAVCVIFVVIARCYTLHRSRAHLAIVLTWNEQYKEDVLEAVAQFFGARHIPAPLRPVVKVDGLRPDEWERLVDRVLGRLNELRQDYREVHLACHAYWLWCFALGTEIQDRHPLVLYHFQESTYHRIWRISREIKNRKAVRDFSYTVCQPPELLRDGERTDAAILVFAVASHDPSQAVKSYIDQHMPDIPAWVVCHEKGLDPQVPDQWVTAACELAHTVDAISGAGSKEVWLFGAVADTLALMAGSAVGPYRRIHLMQYVDGSYQETLRLPLEGVVSY